MAGDFIFDSPQAHEYYNQLRAVSSANNAWNEAQADKQMAFQEASNAKAMDFNAKQAELNRSWQEMMSNTAYQRQVKDMLAAGLNPVLGVSNSGAAVPSGATASGVSATGSKAEADTTMAAAFAQMVNTIVQGQTARDVAEISADAAMKNALTNADAIKFSALYGSEATKYAAGVNAAASRYATSLGYEGLLAQMEHDTFIHQNYPGTDAGIVSSLLSQLLTGEGNVIDFIKETPFGGAASSAISLIKDTGSSVWSFLKGELINSCVNVLKDPKESDKHKENARKYLNWLYK